ncbi:hypothetical protein, partial [Pseudomonas sp.]|uniref:hypothetical protein n=1 Tax=Pseudomonas sp. TaxID=306 RepID=UPI00289E688D
PKRSVGPDGGAQPFLVTFWGVCQKVTRRKGGKVIQRLHRKWIYTPHLKTHHNKPQNYFYAIPPQRPSRYSQCN